jgi:hypothetical protein
VELRKTYICIYGRLLPGGANFFFGGYPPKVGKMDLSYEIASRQPKYFLAAPGIFDTLLFFYFKKKQPVAKGSFTQTKGEPLIFLTKSNGGNAIDLLKESQIP